MKKTLKLIGREEVLVVGMVFVIVGLSFFTTIYEVFSFSELPAERVAVLEHNWTYDFNTYLTKMTQGSKGSWLVYNKYTSEPHGGSLLHVFYLLLGKAGGLLGLSMPLIYLLARVILSFVFFYSLYYLLSQLIKDKGLRLLAFFLSCFATQLPKWLPFSGKEGFDIGFWAPWWTGGDHLQEAAFLPHYILGHVLMLFMFLIFWKVGKKQINWLKGGVLAGILGLATGMIHPPSLMVVYPTVIFCGAWKFLRGDLLRDKFLGDLLKSFLVFLFLSLPSLIYVFYITSRFPWARLSEEVEFLRKLTFFEFAMTTGGVFFLGTAGLVLVLWKKKKELYPFVFWALSVVFLGFGLSKLGIFAQLRAFQTFHRVAFSVLSAYFLISLIKVFKRQVGQVVVGLMVALLMTFSIVSVKRSITGWMEFIDARIHAGFPLVPAPPTIMYPLHDFMDAIYYLRDNSEPQGVVLSAYTAGNYIPAYAGNTVYFGHSETVDFWTKQEIVKKFFSKQMGQEEMRDFLEGNRIRHLFFGPQEREMAKGDFQEGEGFERVFESGYVSVYKYD